MLQISGLVVARLLLNSYFVSMAHARHSCNADHEGFHAMACSNPRHFPDQRLIVLVASAGTLHSDVVGSFRESSCVRLHNLQIGPTVACKKVRRLWRNVATLD